MHRPSFENPIRPGTCTHKYRGYTPLYSFKDYSIRGEKSPHNVVGRGHALCNIPVPDVSPVMALLTMAMSAPSWQLSGNRARIRTRGDIISRSMGKEAR